MLDWREHLTTTPDVCGGRWCVRGTRVLVTNILDSLAEGSSRDEILSSYPSLSNEHVDAALAYAADVAREEALLPQLTEAGVTEEEIRQDFAAFRRHRR